MSKETVISVGESLFLVKGIRRWGLYDFKKGTITIIDKKSGDLIVALCKIQISATQKQIFLKNHALPIWNQIQKLGISKRLFKANPQIIDNKPFFSVCWLELTNACNQQCIFCYAEANPKNTSFISVETARKIIQETRKKGFYTLQLTGGEPFLHPNFWEIVEYAFIVNFPEIEVYTNLTPINRDDLIKLNQFGVKIATTLLGPNALIHDKCTRTNGSFKRWYQNIKELRSYKIPYRIAVVRTKENERFISKIKQFLYNEKIIQSNKLLRIDDCRPCGRGSNTDVLPTKPQVYGLHLNINPNFFYLAQRYNTCWAGKIAISSNGDVYPCIFAREVNVGNINKESFSKIFNSLERKYWKITLDQVEKCKDCELRYACKDCRALSLNTGKGLYGAPVRCNYDPFQETI